MPLKPEIESILVLDQTDNCRVPNGFSQRVDPSNSVPGSTDAHLQVEDRSILADSLPIRIYRSDIKTIPRPLVVFFHGGGWTSGNLDTHDHTCRELARHLGAVVVSVGYRLAPEHQFPVPLLDCFEALKWAEANIAMLGPALGSIILAGTSAGANLAAGVALYSRDHDGPHIDFQLLIYPVVDATMSTASYRSEGNGIVLSVEKVADMWDAYVPNGADRRSPYASPAAAASLAGLPPAVVVTAECDVLCDEGRAYARRLQEEGVRVIDLMYPGQIHGFLLLSDVTPDAEIAIQDAASGLRSLGC